MERDNTLLVGRLQDVLDALGDREPSTRLEAQAVTEKIRLSKGHLDEEVRSDLENLQPRNRNIMLGFVERNREMEAAYTSRYEIRYPTSHVDSTLTSLVSQSSFTPQSTASYMNSSKTPMIHLTIKLPRSVQSLVCNSYSHPRL